MWTALPELKVPRSNHSLAAVVQGRLMVMGGYQGTQTTRKVGLGEEGVDDGREKTSMKQMERRNSNASMSIQAICQSCLAAVLLRNNRGMN